MRQVLHAYCKRCGTTFFWSARARAEDLSEVESAVAALTGDEAREAHRITKDCALDLVVERGVDQVEREEQGT